MKLASTSLRSTAIALCAACVVTLLAISLFLQAYGSPERTGRSAAAAGTYSVSAIGSAGLYDMLRRLDVPVVRSVGRTSSTVGEHGTLVIAEPDTRYITIDDTQSLLSPRRILLVLPKWGGYPAKERPSWLEGVFPLPTNVPRETLALVDSPPGAILRLPEGTSWSVNEINIAPTIESVVQLISSDKLRPIVASDNGILLGEITENDRTVWVLSDPDVMSNHGIGRGENALFMLSLFDALRSIGNTDEDAPLVFDETIHGYREAEKSPFGMLLRFPLVTVTFLIACTFSMLIWSGAGRFGVPARSEPPHDFGKASLISNSARLLDYYGHQIPVLERYIRMTIRSAGDALHISAGMTDAELRAELDRIGKARGVETSCSDIAEAAARAGGGDAGIRALFITAEEAHHWKEVLLNGPSTDQKHRGGNEKRDIEDGSRTG